MDPLVAAEYRLVAKKGEGTFSEVLKAQCIKNGKYVAIKCMKNHFDSLDQVNNLREIQVNDGRHVLACSLAGGWDLEAREFELLREVVIQMHM